MSRDYPIARNNLAQVLLHEGRKKEADELLSSTSKATETTRKEYPRTWIPVLNLALFLIIAKRRGESAGHRGESTSRLSWGLGDYPVEADVLRQTRGPDAAIPLVEVFARDNWWHYGAAIALGRLYAEKGDVPRAEAALRHASWLDVHDAEALSLIASISLRQKRFEDAYPGSAPCGGSTTRPAAAICPAFDILEKMGRERGGLAEVARLKALSRDASALAN